MAAYETHNGQASVAQDGTVTLVRTFRLGTGNAASRPTWGVVGIGILKYDAHPDDSTCLAVDVGSIPVSGELGWFDVSYTYSNKVFDQGVTSTDSGAADPGSQDPTVQPNPLLRTPTVRWGSNSRTVPFTKDYDPDGRKPVQNSAGQPYEGMEVEDFTGTITVSFALGLIDVSAAQQTYMNKVNVADFAVIAAYSPYPAGTLRCNSWLGYLTFDASYGWYTQCEVVLEYKWDGWHREILDQGFYRLENKSGVYVEEKFIDVTTGQNVDAPVKLDGAGGKLAVGAPPVYLTFYPYQEASFTNIFTAV